MARVTLENVKKVYPGGVEAIPELSLEIPDGSFTVLVGPSGCGKSTLLRMVAGLEKVSAGTIRIGERVVNEVEPKDRNIAMVFQNYALYPHMTVRSNLGFGLKLAGAPPEEIDRRIREVAEILGLDTLLDRRPGALSGGQRQRVALGRAMVRKPDVFLYDEPLSNLDAKLRVHTRTEIARLHHRMAATSIYVTHDQVEAMTMATQIVILKDGRVQQIGSPIDVYTHPRNLFVAGFIGSPAMNFLRATLRRGETAGDPRGRHVVSGPRLEGEGFVLGLPEAMVQATAGRPEGPVVLGIRPEHVRDRMDLPDAPATRVATATVEVVEPLGSETLVHARLGAVPIVVRFEGRSAPAVQSPVDLVFDLAEAHLFDPQAETRIG